MKTLIINLIAISLVMSCTNSVHPIVTPENQVFDKRLYGTWRNDSVIYVAENFIKSPLRKIFLRDGLGKPESAEDKKLAAIAAKTYMVSYRTRGTLYTAQCQLTAIDGQQYIQFSEHERDDDSITGSYNYLKTYTFAQIVFRNNNEIELRFPDGGRIKQLVLSGKASIKHEYDEMFDLFAITASTQQLRMFLQKYGKDASLFPPANVVILKRQV